MSIDEFNNYPKNMRLGTMDGSDIGVYTKQEWLQKYILENNGRWDSPEDLIKNLVPSLL